MARKALAINTNGDFETASVRDWIATSGNTIAANPALPGLPAGGTYALEMAPDGTQTTSGPRSELIAVKAGRSYTVNMSAVAVTTGKSIGLCRMYWYDSGGTQIGLTGSGFVDYTARTWVSDTQSHVAPAGAVNARLGANRGGTATSADLWQIDEAWCVGEYALTITAAAHPAPDPDGDWDVVLSMTTDALTTEYGAWRVYRDGVSQAFLTGVLPATRTFQQPRDTVSTWQVVLYKNVQHPEATDQDWRPITRDGQATTVVSTDQGGRSVVVNAAGTAYAFVDIQSWPELRYTRRTATMQVIGSGLPVVNNDFALMPTSSPVLITRSIAERDTLALVLSQPGPLRLVPRCAELDHPWFMPLDFNAARYVNKVSRSEYLTELTMQHIQEPAGVPGIAAASLEAEENPEAPQ